MKKQCPLCGGAVRYLSEKDVFCLDCNWDTLTLLTPTGIIAVDAEWYLKNQLRKYRKWKDADFERVTPDWSGSYGWNHPGIYFHRETVEKHEGTDLFRMDFKRQQRLIPENERINYLAWRLCIRGDELIANGWDIDLIDTLTPYRYHRWRKKRLFVLADLKDVAQHQPPLLGWKNIRKNQIYGNQWEAEKKERKRVKRLEKKENMKGNQEGRKRDIDYV